MSSPSSADSATDVIDFIYNGTTGQNGSIQTWTVPATGKYILETWGASGGNAAASAAYPGANGGAGGYSVGVVQLTAGQTIEVVVGGKGGDGPSGGGGVCPGGAGGFGAGGGGGGGWCNTSPIGSSGAGGGGGLSLVRIQGNGPLIIAGGGGGAGGAAQSSSSNASTTSNCHGGGGIGGAGGGTTGGQGGSATVGICTSGGRGGSQSAGGFAGSNSAGGPADGVSGGSLFGGYGGGYNGSSVTQTSGNPTTFIGGAVGLGGSSSSAGGSGGGGGGYYGGGGGGQRDSGGGGGSGYIGGVTSDATVSITAQTLAGTSSIPNPNGGTMTGNTGNGLVRITRVCVTICIESVTPSKGSISGNTTITITGRGFAANAVVTLDYNGTPAACLSVVVAADGKSLTCVTSAHASGYVSVKVENPAAPGTPTNFTYTGAVQPYTASITGQYILETWGAEGGEMVYSKGGKGGYATGKINLTAGTTLYIYVGSKGGNQSTPGWNGGGASSITQNAHMASGGGGATDIRTVGGNWNDSSGLASRIIVAGGGGGAAYYNIGGAGGGSVGQTGIYSSTSSTYCNAAAQGSGGTQSAGGAGGIHLSSNSNTNGAAGIFGIGGAGGDNGSNYAGASGGGGYWGGGGGAGFWCAGGGGSGYVGSLSSSSLIGGDVTNAMPNPSGGTMTGNTGNGYARITAPAQAADFATCDSCFLYVETFIELTVPTVNVTLSMSNSTPYNYASSDIRVTTNNPTGYKLYLAATGALDASHPEDAVCLDDTLYRFTPTNSGTLPAKTWGLQIGNAVSNSNWLTPTVANMEFAGSSTASGPASNGATYNTHKLWIGAKTDGSLPACVYETSLLVTAVGTNP